MFFCSNSSSGPNFSPKDVHQSQTAKCPMVEKNKHFLGYRVVLDPYVSNIPHFLSENSFFLCLFCCRLCWSFSLCFVPVLFWSLWIPRCCSWLIEPGQKAASSTQLRLRLDPVLSLYLTLLLSKTMGFKVFNVEPKMFRRLIFFNWFSL